MLKKNGTIKRLAMAKTGVIFGGKGKNSNSECLCLWAEVSFYFIFKCHWIESKPTPVGSSEANTAESGLILITHVGVHAAQLLQNFCDSTYFAPSSP